MLLNSGTRSLALAASALSHGGIGVDIFFAISGFLICTKLLDEKSKTGAISLGDFYIRRAFRILPPMLVYLAVISTLTFSGVTSDVQPIEIVSAGFFFRNYIPDTSWYVGHFWSLAIEEHFYLFVPVAISMLPWKSSLQFAIAVAACSAIVRGIEHSWMMDTKVEFRTEGRIDAIMYGAIGALLIHRYRLFFEEHLSGALTLAAVIAALVICFIFPEMPVRRTAIAITTPLPIIYTTLRPTSALGALLQLPPMQWVGKLSYSLYVWQMMFLVPAYIVRPMPLLQSFPAAFFCILGCALISYFLIERPSIRLGQTITQRRPRNILEQVAS
jgi:peptidoglycan/LPS O-acetylase OafA/YrhL